MQYERSHPSNSAAKPEMIPEYEWEHDKIQNPASPAAPSIPYRVNGGMQLESRGRVQIMSPQTVGVNFTGATLQGINNPTNAFPPDCDGAVGPTQYVVGVNGRIVTFNKTTGVGDGVLNHHHQHLLHHGA